MLLSLPPIRFDWDEAVAEIQTRAAEAQACALAAAATPPPAAQTAGPTADPNVAAAVAAHAAAGDLAFKVAMERARRWCVRADFCLWLHADDVHSVEDVTREMMRLGHKRTSAAILAAAAAPTSKLGVAMVRVREEDVTIPGGGTWCGARLGSREG
jgi:hypothetical protein